MWGLEGMGFGLGVGSVKGSKIRGWKGMGLCLGLHCWVQV